MSAFVSRSEARRFLQSMRGIETATLKKYAESIKSELADSPEPDEFAKNTLASIQFELARRKFVQS